MSIHEQSIGASNEWYTPKFIFDALGTEFDLDVAAPVGLRFISVPALDFYCHDSLTREWTGFVWMNPPFGGRNGIVPWLAKFFEHGNGIALTPDRTSAPWWQEYAKQADAILFVDGKIRFIGPDGKEGKSPSCGTTLMAKGEKGVAALRRAYVCGLGLMVDRTVSLPQRRECA